MNGRPARRSRVLRSVVAALFAAAWPASFAAAQFLPDEIARRAECEEFLRTAEIVEVRAIGEGITRPKKVILRKGGIEKTAVWKNPEERDGDTLDQWRFEIAAYRLDKLLGLNMVPPTVERSLDGRPGALSLWVGRTLNLVQVVEQNIVIPPEAEGAFNDMKYVARAWDCLIANDDRTQQNVLYTSDWRTILIDHSRAFGCRGEYGRRLVFGLNGIKTAEDGRPFLFRRLPRRFVRAIERLDREAVREAVGRYLENDEIKAILKRRDILLREIQAMIADQGEDRILYD